MLGRRASWSYKGDANVAKGPEERPEGDNPSDRTVCGIVMPIADFAPYPNNHWSDVIGIIEEAVRAAGFAPKLVSSEDAVGIIQQRIVQNLYENEIVVVDVSGRNPNVMFELGMRLAFDKPVVIIKDELTPYSFDTSPIEHLSYRSDLHYQSVISFKANLAEKLRSTHDASRVDPEHSTFLKHFGRITPATLEKRDGTEMGIVIEELASLRREIRGRGPAGPSYTGPALQIALPPGVTYEEFTERLLAEPISTLKSLIPSGTMNGRVLVTIELILGGQVPSVYQRIKSIYPDISFVNG